jgi:phosphopantothenoylcysteine decarboxylase/phosphopantothenate--cysteine ligase
VADWRPQGVSERKIKKDGSGRAPAVEMAENPDILASVAKLAQPPYCVGFAAESHELAKHASEKRRRKGIPLIVGNLGPATFGRDDNALLLIDDHGERQLPHAGKLQLARELVREIAARLTES